jgi:uroporphyrinogen-III synthase
MRLLVTRPAPDAERTAAVLRARGHEVMLAPMLHIEAVADAELGAPPWSAVLLTSANGARAIPGHPRRAELRGLPVLTVGGSTAEAARAAGFADVTSADGDASDLAALAAQRFAGARAPLLYLAGEDRSGDLAGDLAAHGLSVRTVVIYRAVQTAKFPPAVRTALENGDLGGVLHFSRRSAEGFLRCSGDLMNPALKPVHFCMSERAAERLRRAGATRIKVAARPDETSLLALVAP